ncbi:MAG: ATP phosphoribosyltransferase [archaeon]
MNSKPINIETNFINAETLALLEDKIIILPKNSGLEEYRRVLETLPNDKVIVRGEDVPLFVDKMGAKGINCIGLTGQDLFREYKLKNSLSSISEIKNLGWKEKESLFGKPTLCLLGPIGKGLKNLDSFGVRPKIAINSKYKSIAKNYLGKLAQKGFLFEKVFLSGATEMAASAGIADLVVDIVCSGSSAREAGLRVYERIMESDAILIGVKK